MVEVNWTESALEDLNRIADYIALENEAAAKKLVSQIFSRVEQLSVYPESGRIPPEYNNKIYREVIVGPCRIFYRIDEKFLYVLFVMRGEQKMRKFLLDERNSNLSGT